MQAVRAHPRRALRRVRLLLAAAALACAMAATGCGGGDSSAGDGGASRPERPEGLPADFNIQLFNCAGWRRAGEPVRDYVVRRLHDMHSGEVSARGVQGRGTVLTDEQARRLFDNQCAAPVSDNFVLYKLYGHAASFAGGAP